MLNQEVRAPALLSGSTQRNRRVTVRRCIQRWPKYSILNPSAGDAPGLATLADELADAEVAGLVVELGRRATTTLR